MAKPFLLPSPNPYEVSVASAPIAPALYATVITRSSLSSVTHRIGFWIWVLISTCLSTTHKRLCKSHVAKTHMLLWFKDTGRCGQVFHPRWAILCNWFFACVFGSLAQSKVGHSFAIASPRCFFISVSYFYSILHFSVIAISSHGYFPFLFFYFECVISLQSHDSFIWIIFSVWC